MLQEKSEYFCRALAKATHLAARLYCQGGPLCSHFATPMVPDPAGPYLGELLREDQSAGILVTPLHQVYGFLNLLDGCRLVVGPSRVTNDDPQVLTQQLTLLDIPPEGREAYLQALRAPSRLSPQRMGWLLGLLSMAVDREPLSQEALYRSTQSHIPDIQLRRFQEDAQKDGPSEGEFRDWEYSVERLILSYVRHGEPEPLRELFTAPPNLQGGPMADNALRQVKNTCVCAAAVASRTAIDGGADPAAAFHLSDLYIQRTEALQDVPSLERLRNEMFIAFAELVEKVRYNTGQRPSGKTGELFASCAEYVSRNIYSAIRIEEMAKAMGYTRSYLCDRFKKQTGLTLTQYVAQQKVLEAQRMLEFTDSSLGEIAELFAFSSQSHFQNVFKKITGETPLAYRRRIRRRGK